MSILIRGIAILRPLYRNRFFAQNNGGFSSISARYTEAFLRFSSPTYPFPPSPPSEIQPEETGPIVPSFLEEPTIEYGNFENVEPHHESTAALSPEAQAAEVILRLIAKGELDEALVVKEEYDRLGIGISRESAFVNAAIAELSVPKPEVWRKRFTAWWSLAPLDECPDQVALMCSKLMDHSYCIPLLMDFSLVCAKAGFAQDVEKTQLFQHIFRYGNPNATTVFLLKMEDEARKVRKGTEPNSWMIMRNSAIRMHFVAGRRQIAMQLYMGARASGFIIQPQTHKLMVANTHTMALPTESISMESLYDSVPKHRYRSTSVLAHELRILRRIVTSRKRPPRFEHFLAGFIDAYEHLGRRSRAIRMLRAKVFRDATPAVRARWVAGEQLAYSMHGRSIAVLRTFMHYCLADNVLAAEARPILASWRERGRSVRKYKDWKLSQKPVKADWKIWPTGLSLSLTWKALLQLSSRRDNIRIYDLFLKHIQVARSSPQRLADDLNLQTKSDWRALKIVNEEVFSVSKDMISVPPATFPAASHFHHFIVSFATRFAPRQGAQVLRDMQRLGYKPSKASWGALAGAYARSGDLQRVLRILDHLDRDIEEERTSHAFAGARKSWTESGERARESETRPPRSLLVTYNSVLRGFTEAGMYPEARIIQRRMQNHGLFKGEVDKRTRAILHRLSRYERAKYNGPQSRRRRKRVVVGGRAILVDRGRAEWLMELKD